MVNHYKELILEHRLEIFFKHFVIEKTLTDDETVNTTKEIHFFPSLKFVPHLEPVNLRNFALLIVACFSSPLWKDLL